MLEPIVVDASAWLAVLLDEEGSDVIKSILEDHPLLAPDLIRYEGANGILYAHRRSGTRLKKSDLKNLMSVVWDFPIQEIPMKVWWEPAIDLIERSDLTFYDAAYAGAAIALKVPLLTLDGKLLKVMKAEGIAAIS